MLCDEMIQVMNTCNTNNRWKNKLYYVDKFNKKFVVSIFSVDTYY